MPKIKTLGWGNSTVATKYVYTRIGEALNSKDLDEMSQQLSNLYSELAHNYKVDTGTPIGQGFPASYQWQVGYDSENTPAFGLEVYEDEAQASDRAHDLNARGEKSISLTKLENNAAIEVWKWVDDGWE